MRKLLAYAFSGCLAAGAITALTIFALRIERGRFDRSSVANLSGASLDPTTTASITSRDDTGAPYHKRVEGQNKNQLGTLMPAIAPAR